MTDINNLDGKFQLFCKWLEQNDQKPMINAELEQPSTLTEDEVSSFATNSDDSGSDIFLDTESDFPEIVLTHDDENEGAFILNGDGKLNDIDSTNQFRVDTPSQLSVSDFDGSSSDITVNSQISTMSGLSNQNKRKAKHNKGRAPPIPTNIINDASDENNCNTNEKSMCHKTTTDVLLNCPNEFPSIAKSTRETDI